MALILAIEPDRRQAAKIGALAHDRLHAELLVVNSVEKALATLATRTPDLVLTPLLLSTADDAMLTDRLRELDAAGESVQTLVIPLLVTSSGDSDDEGGLFSLFRRGKSKKPSTEGCDVSVFGDQIAEYLERAAIERVHRARELAERQERAQASAAVASQEAATYDESAVNPSSLDDFFSPPSAGVLSSGNSFEATPESDTSVFPSAYVEWPPLPQVDGPIEESVPATHLNSYDQEPATALFAASARSVVLETPAYDRASDDLVPHVDVPAETDIEPTLVSDNSADTIQSVIRAALIPSEDAYALDVLAVPDTDAPQPVSDEADPGPASADTPLETSEEDWHEITLDVDEPEVQAIGEITEVAPDLAAFVAELAAVTSLGALSETERTWNPSADASHQSVSSTPEQNHAEVIDVTPSVTWPEAHAAVTIEPPPASNAPVIFGRLEVEPLEASPSLLPEPLGSVDASRQSILSASEQDRAEVVDVAPSVILPKVDAAVTVEPPPTLNAPVMFGRLEVEPFRALPSLVPREPLGSVDASRQSILSASEQDRAEVVDVAPSVILPKVDAAVTVEPPPASNAPVMFGRLEVKPFQEIASLVPRANGVFDDRALLDDSVAKPSPALAEATPGELPREALDTRATADKKAPVVTTLNGASLAPHTVADVQVDQTGEGTDPASSNVEEPAAAALGADLVEAAPVAKAVAEPIVRAELSLASIGTVTPPRDHYVLRDAAANPTVHRAPPTSSPVANEPLPAPLSAAIVIAPRLSTAPEAGSDSKLEPSTEAPIPVGDTRRPLETFTLARPTAAPPEPSADGDGWPPIQESSSRSAKQHQPEAAIDDFVDALAELENRSPSPSPAAARMDSRLEVKTPPAPEIAPAMSAATAAPAARGPVDSRPVVPPPTSVPEQPAAASAKPAPNGLSPDWIDMLTSIKRDVEQLRVQQADPVPEAPKKKSKRRGKAAPRATAAVKPEAPKPDVELAKRPSAKTDHDHTITAASPPSTPERSKPDRSKAKPKAAVQDEWGFFDPDQCGFAALLAKLEEISDKETPTR